MPQPSLVAPPLPAAAVAAVAPVAGGHALRRAVAELESRSIRAALASTHGNKVAAARLLGIARATLYEKLAAMEAAQAAPVAPVAPVAQAPMRSNSA
jgi:DNA-binding NtrC family response regulator